MTNTLRVARLASAYLVPRDHPAPLKLRAEMDDLARQYISDFCARALSGVLDADDPSVWVIGDVTLDLLVDVHAAPPQDIADIWARKIAAVVARVIASGEDGTNVLRFANRAAFLAHFLRSLAEEQAWQKWYFAEFHSLRSLPRSAAIREALLREPAAEADAVLMELDRLNTLPPVIAALSSRDQELILTVWSHQATCSADALRAVLRIGRSIARADTSLIGLYARVRKERPEMAVSEAAGAADHAFRILRWARTGDLRRRLGSLANGAALLSPLSPEETGTVMMLRNIAAAEGSDSLTALVALADAVDPGKDRFELVSDLGAVFLLAVVLLETPDLLDLFGGPEHPVRRYLLFTMCFCRSLPGAWRDPALRLAAGISDPPDASALRAIRLGQLSRQLRESASPEDMACLASEHDELLPDLILDPETHTCLTVCAAVLLRAFARRLPALGGSSFDYLWRNVLAGDARIEVADDSIIVRLKPRPLQIVLRMAWLHGETLALPWCAPRRMAIRFDGT